MLGIRFQGIHQERVGVAFGLRPPHLLRETMKTKKPKQESEWISKAARLPVVSTDMEWKEFVGITMRQWERSTRLMNTCMQILINSDISPVEAGVLNEKYRANQLAKKKKPDEEDSKFPSYPADINLYDIISKMLPDLPSSTVATMTRDAWKKYNPARRGYLFFQNDSMPVFDFPYPIVVPAARVKIYQDKDYIVIEAGLYYGVDGKLKTVKLYLANGSDYSYSNNTLLNMLHGKMHPLPKKADKGPFPFGSVKIELVRTGVNSTFRPLVRRRDKFGESINYKVQVSIPVKHRRYKLPSLPKMALLHTDANHLFVAHISEREAWRVNEDHVAGRLDRLNTPDAYAKAHPPTKKNPNAHIASSAQILEWATKEIDNSISNLSPDELKDFILAEDARKQSLSEDIKFRAQTGHRMRIRGVQTKRSKKRHDWLNTWCHQLISYILSYMKRNNVTRIYYYDRERKFLPHFAWAKVHTMLFQACHAIGIELVHRESKDAIQDWSGEFKSVRGQFVAERNAQKEAALAQVQQIALQGGKALDKKEDKPSDNQDGKSPDKKDNK